MDSTSRQREGDAESVCSSSNPSLWEGHFPRKMMDLTWNFTAGPLRVTDCTSKQWARLHATHKWAIPQPGAAPPLEVSQKLPHLSDDALMMQIAASGLAKPKKEITVKKWESARPQMSTPEMHERLRATAVKPLPKPPGKEEAANNAPLSSASLLPALQNRTSASSVASSVFSVTTVASRKSVAAASARNDQRTTTAEEGDEPTKRPDDKALSQVGSSIASAAGRDGKGARSSVSVSSSTSSRVSKLSQQLSKHKEEGEAIKTAMSVARERLDAVEALLGKPSPPA